MVRRRLLVPAIGTTSGASGPRGAPLLQVQAHDEREAVVADDECEADATREGHRVRAEKVERRPSPTKPRLARAEPDRGMPARSGPWTTASPPPPPRPGQTGRRSASPRSEPVRRPPRRRRPAPAQPRTPGARRSGPTATPPKAAERQTGACTRPPPTAVRSCQRGGRPAWKAGRH